MITIHKAIQHKIIEDSQAMLATKLIIYIYTRYDKDSTDKELLKSHIAKHEK